MLPGLSPERLIAVGDSQSAFRLTTYLNGVDPLAQLFDGFLIHSRGAGSAALSQSPQSEIDTPDLVFIRSDVRVPVLTFQTETDIFRLGFITDRQPDAHNIALWEVAGTAHGDVYNIALSVGPQDIGDNPTVAEVVEVERSDPGHLRMRRSNQQRTTALGHERCGPRSQRLGQWRAAAAKTKRTLVGDRRRRIRR